MNTSVQPKITKIKKSLEIKNILKQGLKIYTTFGIFFLTKDKGKDISFAVLIQKSVGKAVHRNYCKRIVREYFRNNILKFGQFNRIIFLYNYSGLVNNKLLCDDFNNKLIKI